MNPPHGPVSRLSADQIDDAVLIIQDVFRHFRSHLLEQAGHISHTSKEDGSPVTDTDIEVELRLQAELARRFPDVPVFGEETGYAAHLSGAFWLVDPIDGTKSFIEGIPAFTNMAVLIQDGEAAAAVIYNPSHNDMFIARKGSGAYKNGARLDLGAIPLPSIALCKTCFMDDLDVMFASKGIRYETGDPGGGYGFTLVAEGLVAARFQLHGNGYTHDYAPGALLVREAGGSIIPIKDDVYTYESRSFVACHPELESIVRANLHALRDLENLKD